MKATPNVVFSLSVLSNRCKKYYDFSLIINKLKENIMGANPVWVSINPRKEGECFSLPSEIKKLSIVEIKFNEK